MQGVNNFGKKDLAITVRRKNPVWFLHREMARQKYKQKKKLQDSASSPPVAAVPVMAPDKAVTATPADKSHAKVRAPPVPLAAASTKLVAPTTPKPATFQDSTSNAPPAGRATFVTVQSHKSTPAPKPPAGKTPAGQNGDIRRADSLRNVAGTPKTSNSSLNTPGTATKAMTPQPQRKSGNIESIVPMTPADLPKDVRDRLASVNKKTPITITPPSQR